MSRGLERLKSSILRDPMRDAAVRRLVLDFVRAAEEKTMRLHDVVRGVSFPVLLCP